MQDKIRRGLFWVVMMLIENGIRKFYATMYYQQLHFQEEPIDYLKDRLLNNIKANSELDIQVLSVKYVDHTKVVQIGENISYYVKRGGVWEVEICKCPIELRLCNITDLPFLPIIGEDAKASKAIDQIIETCCRSLIELYDIFFANIHGPYEGIVCLGWGPGNVPAELGETLNRVEE